MLASAASAAITTGNLVGPHRSAADSSRVTAYPNIFHGWQWGVGTSGNWPARVAEARGWLRPAWYWTGTDAGFELWKGGQGLRVTDFSVDS